ncbi:T9SS type A sorting domain-containing protein [Spirosoma lacussanchae]|uniref:T9SS type A sorting domain-containing protein n=1 Tax=Spirosoma lacussanchae TaxID=1884249 RepID=UPI001108DCDA|nr:T9SS type A sorting domain-containing protein [Spirosoma lacussanchae]
MFQWKPVTAPVGVLLLIGLFCPFQASAQSAGATPPDPSIPYQAFVRQLRTSDAGAVTAPRVVCYLSGQNGSGSVPPPEAFLRARQASNGRQAAPTAQFIVDYRNFTPEAQRAFQYAVDIWATQIASPVPIRIQASWISQEPGVLGAAGPSSYRAGADGVQKGYGYYPVALAEKVARRALNSDSEPDIVAQFNRNNEWYYGTDGKTPPNQPDLVTAALHEIAHGLGFIGFFDVVNSVGYYSAGLPSVYDHLIINGIDNGPAVRPVADMSSMPGGSVALGSFLTNNNLFLNGPQLVRQFGRRLPRLSAQSPFDRAVSLYHLNEDSYSNDSLNRLMRPRLKLGQATHSPGQITLTTLADLEWKTTSVLHTPLDNSEDPKDLVFSARIVSDTAYAPNSVRLFYRKSRPAPGDTAVTAVPMTQVGTTGEFRATLPAAQAQGEVWYYLSAQDVSGRTFTNPGKLPAGAQALYRVLAGPDLVPPTIRYSPSKHLILNTAVADSLPISALIADDRITGVESAFVEYQINGVAQPNLPLPLRPATINGVRYDSLYTSRLSFPANSLKAGDRITYRIVARDGSRNRNLGYSPASGTYKLRVVAPQPARDRYVTSFQEAATVASDFATAGLNLNQPAGFSDPALHSDHPYRNGADYLGRTQAEATLLVPIRIAANPDSAVIRFDEIALIQPADYATQFGEPGFNDYAIVEGSADNGRSWRPLVDGYNALDQTDWLAAYNRSLVDGTLIGERNSNTVGLPALYKRRTIPLIGAGGFRAGETILIRFRLFIDRINYGWGWAIDNLRIQVPPPPIVLGNEPISAASVTVFPNPLTSGLLTVRADYHKPIGRAELRVTDLTGRLVWRTTLPASGTSLNRQIDLSSLPTGLYRLQLNLGDAVLTRQILIAH